MIIRLPLLCMPNVTLNLDGSVCPESVSWVAVNDLSLSDHIRYVYICILIAIYFKCLHVMGLYKYIYIYIYIHTHIMLET